MPKLYEIDVNHDQEHFGKQMDTFWNQGRDLCWSSTALCGVLDQFWTNVGLLLAPLGAFGASFY